MGGEDPWFAVVGGAVALLIVAAVVLIPIRVVQLLARQRRGGRGD